MKLILLVDVPKIGKKHEIVEVNDGYGKNFLLKKKLAVMPTDSNLKKLNETLVELQSQEEEKIKDATLLKNKLESQEYELSLKVNNSKTFGVITNKNIIDKVNENEELIDKFMFLESHKLSIGHYKIKICLYKEVFAILNIHIKASN